MEKEEIKFTSSNKKFHDQQKFVQKVHAILLDVLNTADEDEFHEQLHQLKPSLAIFTDTCRKLFFQIYPDKYCDRRPIEIDGETTYAYYNIFHHYHPINDIKRNEAYRKEAERHKGIKLPPKRLSKNNLRQTLSSGQSYNFIINLFNEAYIAYEQRYRLQANGKEILASPNHTLLAGNNPVLAAGVLKYYKVGRKELFFISCASGHFHPKPDSLDHMKKYLISVGIPEEAIIVLCLKYDQIVAHNK